jgi:adenylate cyclase
MGHQTLVAEVGHNVSKTILGIPYEPTDLNTINIDIEKNNNKIKAIHKEDLVKEEISKINQFRLNIRMDFSETVIRIHYVTFLDVFAELGGLNASVNSILG